MDRPPITGFGRTMIAVGHDGDVIVYTGEEDVYEIIGDETGSGSGGICGSWVIDSGSTFHICLWRECFDSFCDLSGGAVTLADGSTLSMVGVGSIRFRMWNGMIRTIMGVWYVPSIRWGLVSLSELDSRGYELRIYGGSIDVLRGDMVVIQGIKRSGLYEMVGTVEFAVTVVPAGTSTGDVRPDEASDTVFVETVPMLAGGHRTMALCTRSRAVGGADVTHCCRAMVVDTGRMAKRAIGQRPGRRQAGGGRFGYLDTHRRLDTSGGRRGHVVTDTTWGIGHGWLRAVDSGLMR